MCDQIPAVTLNEDRDFPEAGALERQLVPPSPTFEMTTNQFVSAAPPVASVKSGACGP
jgi:hypothetical protein